jgi:hypothetical protein
VASGKAFGITGNRVLAFPDRTPMANLQLTLLDKFGVDVEKFGDSDGRLKPVAGV